MSDVKSKLTRRQFLTVVGAGGAVAATAVAHKVSQTLPAATPSTKRQGKGYQLTEHVRRYYRTTLV